MLIRNLIHAVIKTGTNEQQSPVSETESYFLVSKAALPKLAEAYARWLEVSKTSETCKCEWAVHPDDPAELGICRECYLPAAHSCHGADSEDYTHTYRPRRLRLKEEHPLCPLHSRVGRVTGFFEWLFLVHVEQDDAASDS